MTCNTKQLAGSTVHIFTERYFQTDINLFPVNIILFMDKSDSWFLLEKHVKKHLWKSNILSEDAGQ